MGEMRDDGVVVDEALRDGVAPPVCVSVVADDV